VAAAKRVMRATAALPLASGQRAEAEAFGALFATEDTREGLKAFVEKRPAAFRGR
jgi:enoyl-CoA hydratase